MSSTTGVGLSDLACQKSNFCRSCSLPYSKSATVGSGRAGGALAGCLAAGLAWARRAAGQRRSSARTRNRADFVMASSPGGLGSALILRDANGCVKQRLLQPQLEEQCPLDRVLAVRRNLFEAQRLVEVDRFFHVRRGVEHDPLIAAAAGHFEDRLGELA